MTHPYEAILNGVSDIACGGDAFPPAADLPRLRAEMDVRALRDILAYQREAVRICRWQAIEFWHECIAETLDRLADAEARLAEALAAAMEPTPPSDGMDGTEL